MEVANRSTDAARSRELLAGKTDKERFYFDTSDWRRVVFPTLHEDHGLLNWDVPDACRVTHVESQTVGPSCPFASNTGRSIAPGYIVCNLYAVSVARLSLLLNYSDLARPL